MSNFFDIIYNIIAPIFLVAGISVVVDRVLAPDPRPISRLAIYLFTPFLVLNSLASSDLQAGETGRLALLAVAVSLGMTVIAWIVARAAGFDRRLESAFLLTAVLINAGNFGLALNRFAFGAEGEARALVFFVVTVVISNSFGVFLASRGSTSTRQAFLNVFKIPLPYAAAIGLILNLTDTELPVPIARSTALLAQASVPTMLTVLGIQLSRTSLRGRIGPVLLASGLRLIVAPLLAVPLALALGLSGLTRDVAIVQSAMPVAVVSGVLATEFGSDADFVTATILVSTLLSIVTLGILLALLGVG
ncbi:MAG: AEC family transporter [Chloroflexi bacterium]|nr:AEC family transporter [Chloroflexota bacterium]